MTPHIKQICSIAIRHVDNVHSAPLVFEVGRRIDDLSWCRGGWQSMLLQSLQSDVGCFVRRSTAVIVEKEDIGDGRQ